MQLNANIVWIYHHSRVKFESANSSQLKTHSPGHGCWKLGKRKWQKKNIIFIFMLDYLVTYCITLFGQHRFIITNSDTYADHITTIIAVLPFDLRCFVISFLFHSIFSNEKKTEIVSFCVETPTVSSPPKIDGKQAAIMTSKTNDILHHFIDCKRQCCCQFASTCNNIRRHWKSTHT